MNSYALKIIGSSPIEAKLDDSKDYSVAFKRLGIKRVVKEPLEQDGEHKYTFVCDNLADLTVISEDKIILGKNKSNSKRIRNRAWIYSNDQGIDNEKFYNDFSSALITNFDSVVEFLRLDT